MRRAFEVIFGHRFPLLMLLLLPLMIGVATAFVLPASYQAMATIWALRRYAIIGATGPESNLLETPASTQAAAMNELLQTRVFALAVANDANLAVTLDASVRADPQSRNDALYLDISSQVKAVAEGYNLISLSYINRDPGVAQQVLQATIHNYGVQSIEYAIVKGQQLLQTYQTQLTKAQEAAAAAAAAEAQYRSQHPQLSDNDLANDPQYVLLHLQTKQAQNQVTSLQDQIATIQQQLAQQGSDASGLFQVVDAPVMPSRPISRGRTLLLSGGVGLTAAVLACLAYLVMLMRRDRSVYAALDLQGVSSLPVVAELPHVPVVIASLASDKERGRKRKRSPRLSGGEDV